MLRVFIADDEAPARLRLRALLSDIEAELPNRVVGEAANGQEALERLSALAADDQADVALVDIRMPGMDGVELATRLAALPRPPVLVFCTAYDQYAVRAFELQAVDYLMKPVRANRLLDALRRVPERRSQPAEAGRSQLSCSERGRILLLPVADILYLRAELKYVTARTAAREYLLEEALAALEQEFARRFVRIHRNCLVARDAVIGFEHVRDGAEGHWAVVLKGLDERLPVSRRQWAQVRAEFADIRGTERG
ncbi:MAG: response regulator transcription factor [Methyloversatilis discipulorum]|uniref:LytR/AlgR family response regulator transcription factor n=1 Tax=Methyloversatilis discipulorum TaxID=1119528 RepID=UPI0026EB0714|nr:LytTR family DNA-binding domain-containing protein [Methyloversatilis discipulorum]MBV5286742.1 response regulator transcription factor [Methyloversatilis discipulorum]